MLRAAKPYSPRLFSHHTLGQLSDAEAALAIVGPAGLQGVELSKAAVELIVGRSGGHPYFLQEYGRVLWDEIDTPPITAEHVGVVEEIVDDNLDRGFFAPAFELATDAEQRYLTARQSRACWVTWLYRFLFAVVNNHWHVLRPSCEM
jgi:hypothetical protein